MKLFVSPHNDDAVLFGSFRIQQQEAPLVLTVFDSHIQLARGHGECSAPARRYEDMAAMTILGCDVAFSGIPDSEPAELVRTRVAGCLAHWNPEEVWLPAVEEDGHEQHNLVGEIGLQVYQGARIHRYLTYTRAAGRSVNGVEIKPTGLMVLKKLKALAMYRTQIEIDALGCFPHFMDLREFEAV